MHLPPPARLWLSTATPLQHFSCSLHPRKPQHAHYFRPAPAPRSEL